jgi:uncharacterized protein (DUF1501 family)
MNRREFLASLAKYAAATAVLGGAPSRARAAAEDALLQRRHLIHIHLVGAWDALWFHNGVRARDIGPALSGCGAIFNPNDGSTDLARYAASVSTCGSPTAQPDRWHQRYGDTDVGRMPDGTLVGPGMSMFSDADKAQMTIVRGIDPMGGHGVANELYLFGTSKSAGRPSFAAYAARAFERDYGVRPLQHVAAGGYLSYSGDGDAIGAARTIPIASFDQLSRLTEQAPHQPAGEQRRILRDAADRLGQLSASGYARQRGKDLVTGYSRSYKNLNDLLDGGLASRVDPASFRATWMRYVAGIRATMNAHPFVTTFFPNHYSVDHRDMTAGGALTDNFAASTYFGDAFLSDPTSLPRPGYDSLITRFAFKMALAEYLTVNNLSAVVELEDFCGDCHASQSTQVLVMLVVYTALQMLIQKLRETGLIERTTLVMMSDFDRAPVLSADNPAANADPGTGHWSTASMIFAGCGVNTTANRFGDFNRSDGMASSLATDTGFVPGGIAPLSEVGPYQAVPIDLTTGAYKRKSEGGARILGSQIFPTLLSCTGASNLVAVNLEKPLSALLRS